MLVEFRQTLRRMRGQIMGWSIGIGLYGLLMVLLFDSITTIEGFEELIASYPEELMAFFGAADSMFQLTSPKGYLDVYYFGYMTLIIGIFTIGASTSLLVGDEERGTLDLVMAHPLSRTALFWGRLLAFVTATVIILFVGWLSWFLPSGTTSMDLTWIEFLRPFLPLFAVLMLFSTLATLLTMVLPSARFAGMVTGGLLVANFLLNGLSNINDDISAVVKYTPLHYYQGGNAILGINWEWLLGLLGISMVFAVLAWWRFHRRDIRVGGESGWKLPRLTLRKSRAESLDL